MDNLITPELLDIIAFIESSNNPKAVNKRTGARGAYQFLPIAWQDVQENYPNLKQYGYDYAFNPEISRQFAQSLLELNAKRLGSNLNLDNLLGSYNWGYGNVTKKGLNKAPKETLDYINKVKKYQKQGLPSKTHYKK